MSASVLFPARHGSVRSVKNRSFFFQLCFYPNIFFIKSAFRQNTDFLLPICRLFQPCSISCFNSIFLSQKQEQQYHNACQTADADFILIFKNFKDSLSYSFIAFLMYFQFISKYYIIILIFVKQFFISTNSIYKPTHKKHRI